MRPTRAGWTYFAFTLGVGFAAMNTGNNLLYMVLSLLLAFLVLSGVLSEWSLRDVEVRRFLPGELRAEADGFVGVEFRNTSRRFPSFAVVAEDLFAAATPRGDPSRVAGRAFAFRVGPGETLRRRYRIRPERRGPLALAGFRVATRFPFGLFSKAMRVDAPVETLVFPAIDPVAVEAVASRANDMANDGSDAQGRGGLEAPEITGLRAYAPGDPHSRVHWRSSLRSGRLLVRERAHELPQQHTVRLHTRGVEPGAAFEAAVRRAASEVHAWAAAGLRVGLATDQIDISPASGRLHRAELLELLARIEPDPAQPAPPSARSAA